ncbi:DUF1613 domain-containing protein [Arthroderma uncinatum]|uniref:DUF1613 domain-containing protein n=1 Tax=Arthroderma uncinatum TaxID=74035 RepID=UPI00144A5D9A|nr:DUF1613 domain-containing protein [Arthroderma uncinatum]KAF3490713.1 DUF1613 domain-containing protein [Arthroderma uncinatum]
MHWTERHCRADEDIYQSRVLEIVPFEFHLIVFLGAKLDKRGVHLLVDGATHRNIRDSTREQQRGVDDRRRLDGCSLAWESERMHTGRCAGELGDACLAGDAGGRTSPTDFAQSLESSCLADGENWITAPSLSQPGLGFSPDVFLSVSTHLLANPNLISPSLFRADILHDSWGVLETTADRESSLPERDVAKRDETRPSRPVFLGFELQRVVVRRLIPRNPNLDPAHDQTCHLYKGKGDQDDVHKTSYLAVYYPHATSEQDMPFYHPVVRGFALLYSHDDGSSNGGIMSLHFLPFSPDIPSTIPNRLHRTLLNLLSIHIRLASGPSATSHPSGTQPRPFKDNLIPQHTVQNTYTKLKSKYAPSLVKNWVEVTEPSKHVFEDLSIAAFLIELWKTMYHLPASDSTLREEENGHDVMGGGRPEQKTGFPGFVDIACGNGVLVYILLSEGYGGWGFDARSRKTWSIFPSWVQEQLKERTCVPQPFKDVLPHASDDNGSTISGQFKDGTFIISNHADELTLWTPLLGIISNPSQPLPFLAIPCCSHGLSGARYRYPPPRGALKGGHKETTENEQSNENIDDEHHDHNSQPESGDLKALRAKKLEAQKNPGSLSSTYGCLTAKLVSIAEEVGYEVDKTLLRIPSTRNIGVIGGLKAWQAVTSLPNTASIDEPDKMAADVEERKERVQKVVERETDRDAGLCASAESWVERSMGLNKGQGRGKLNCRNEHHD